MSYISKTSIPNHVFDNHLKQLGHAELKVLLVVIRQTLGWIDRYTKKTKEWDWISQQFFVRKTGLSARAISSAITSLLQKDLILIKNETGKLVYSNKDRQLSQKLYYKFKHENNSCEVKALNPVKKSHTTIIKHTKMYNEKSSHGFNKLNFKHLKT